MSICNLIEREKFIDETCLSMVSFYSFCNAALNKKVLPEEIKSAQTVEDLFKLANT